MICNYRALRMVVLFSVLLLIKSGTAQVRIAADDTASQKYFLDMMQDPNVNFYSAQSAFNKYWTGKTDYKGNGWKVFKRWEYILSLIHI